ncbi:MAG: ribonucleoside-diphosphate reductase, adenosylcobalamin-dependent [Bdellovibrionales bacterium RIFOXYC1_FULL_54_43]|nr:MAG: ribonucleoside-diphosphate reductase, adenosylcobalamin-dependent [Bdellovibrionales bacterium RIFOXYC1_FULL_54_43]OFZ81993.1 MAG: ribonucleoside-diphosphate reductase, adenosylcobalamin-dependent [Bdellovibrionales bacterium RIFOXYD1_FULL_55_31]
MIKMTRPDQRFDAPPRLTENARTVLERRYLWRDEKGALSETPAELFARVAQAVAAPEMHDRAHWADRFYSVMASLRFLPNTPTLMNAGGAGARGGQLSACFVLPIEDSLGSIFDSLKFAALIHQSGGGTGFSFSKLRPKGSPVGRAQGIASGPVSYIRVFDAATEAIKQGGARRGANMAVLRVDHPDILEFIDSKRDKRSVGNFNISVGVTDEFMNSATATGGAPQARFFLRDPRSGEKVQEVRAAELFDRIVRAAWDCGDPGLVFLDRINEFNPTPNEGPIESTNPCGEQPLLPYESCNLGSLNVLEYFSEAGFDWDRYREDIRLAVRFLDNVIDVNFYPVEACRTITLKNRKIGLGVMGFADLLLMMGLPYGSEDARAFGEKLMRVLNTEAKEYSAVLARERGAFPNWHDSLWRRRGLPPLRNATVSTVAPAGTISIIAGVSSGIEPIFAAAYYRNILSGARLLEVHPAVARALGTRPVARVDDRGRPLTARAVDEELGRALGTAWTPARRVSVEDHVKMQAAFQRHCDAAVSKTINLPESSGPEEVLRAYRLAYELGCKGVTVYRDRSRTEQVLESAPDDVGVCSSC